MTVNTVSEICSQEQRWMRWWMNLLWAVHIWRNTLKGGGCQDPPFCMMSNYDLVWSWEQRGQDLQFCKTSYVKSPLHLKLLNIEMLDLYNWFVSSIVWQSQKPNYLPQVFVFLSFSMKSIEMNLAWNLDNIFWISDLC